MEHLCGYGLDRDAARVSCLVADTAPVPLELLRMAMQTARQTVDSDFPPTPFRIIQIAKKICQDTQPELYRTATGYLASPDWYLRMTRKRYNAEPRQISAAH